MEYLIHLGIIISLWAIVSMSLNLIVGYTGLLSVTHAAFFGTGAYTTAILTTQTEIGFFLSVLIGIIVTAIIAGLFGLMLSRFKGDYYALVSFGFNIIVFSIFINWNGLTKGPLGIPGIDRPELFGFVLSDNLYFLMLAVIVLFGVYYLSEFITNSSLGRALKAIREDENTIKVFGYRTPVYKLFIFIVGSSIAAVAGSLFASYITFIDPGLFKLDVSIFMLALIILGGLANHKGAILGAAILILLPELFRFIGFSADIAGQMRLLLYGLLLVLLMMYRPQGLIGEYKL